MARSGSPLVCTLMPRRRIGIDIERHDLITHIGNLEARIELPRRQIRVPLRENKEGSNTVKALLTFIELFGQGKGCDEFSIDYTKTFYRLKSRS